MKNQNYYKLKNKADNPDQRITEDINQFIELTIFIGVEFFKSFITLFIFGYALLISS